MCDRCSQEPEGKGSQEGGKGSDGGFISPALLKPMAHTCTTAVSISHKPYTGSYISSIVILIITIIILIGTKFDYWFVFLVQTVNTNQSINLILTPSFCFPPSGTQPCFPHPSSSPLCLRYQQKKWMLTLGAAMFVDRMHFPMPSGATSNTRT